MTKKSVLLIGLIGTLFVLSLFFLDTNLCYSSTSCMEIRSFLNNDIFALIFLTPPLFILSLITYKMKEEVFRTWWNFARWWVPVIIIATLLLENAGGGGGWGISSGIFEFAVLWLLYIIFIVTSLVKIVRAYLRTRG